MTGCKVQEEVSLTLGNNRRPSDAVLGFTSCHLGSAMRFVLFAFTYTYSNNSCILNSSVSVRTSRTKRL
jgi:hypothetical protein